MLLGALLDAGAALDVVRSAVAAVVPGEVEVRTRVVSRAGLRALKVDVASAAEDHPHRAWAQIRSLLHAADLPDPVRERALAAFGLLADAEARVHGRHPDEVHFHEVGSWDSIADIVGVAAALADLGVDRVVTSAGRGGIGPGPLRPRRPAGAGARGPRAGEGLARVRGRCGRARDADRDGLWYGRCPTSAAHSPRSAVSAVGIGAGGRDVAERANVVRVVVGRARGAGRGRCGSWRRTSTTWTPAVADGVVGAARAGRRRRVARADPHEEGPTGPHARPCSPTTPTGTGCAPPSCR